MEFRIGGKITLEGKQYIIIDIMELNNHKYLYCTTTKGKIKAIIFKIDTFEKLMPESSQALEKYLASRNYTWNWTCNCKKNN